MTGNPGKNKARNKMLQAWWERTTKPEMMVQASVKFV